ncbi:MAG: TraB/GumN family protein [Pseudomonadota bacterium]
MCRLFSLLVISFSLLSACERVPVTDGAVRKVEEARARNDGPPMWRVQDEDSTLYLYGTVHLLPGRLDWQRDDMREAFAQAGTVFFEADHSGADGVQAQALATQRGLRRDGRRLTEILDSYQAKLLEAVANNGDIALEALDSMQPWLASEYLTLSAAESAGLSADISADEALKSRARQSGKNLIFFETATAQVNQMADLPQDTQLALLTDTMERFDLIGDTLSQIAQDWAVGDVDALERQLIDPLANAPEGYAETVLTQRNDAWAEELDEFLQGSGTGFVAIGISHLLGENSLQDALEDRGYDVKRYLAFLGEDVIRPVNLDLPDVPTD